MPTCKDCGKEKEERLFATFKTRKGELRRRSVCWECRGKYAKKNFTELQAWRKKHYKKTRPKQNTRSARLRAEAKAFVDAFKNKPCADCGKRWPPVAMDLDHVRGQKIRGVANMVSAGYKTDLIAKELEKCEVVCACCHRLRTHARDQHWSPLSGPALIAELPDT